MEDLSPQCLNVANLISPQQTRLTMEDAPHYRGPIHGDNDEAEEGGPEANPQPQGQVVEAVGTVGNSKY
jgi:hypothetical protein